VGSAEPTNPHLSALNDHPCLGRQRLSQLREAMVCKVIRDELEAECFGRDELTGKHLSMSTTMMMTGDTYRQQK